MQPKDSPVREPGTGSPSFSLSVVELPGCGFVFRFGSSACLLCSERITSCAFSAVMGGPWSVLSLFCPKDGTRCLPNVMKTFLGLHCLGPLPFYLITCSVRDRKQSLPLLPACPFL